MDRETVTVEIPVSQGVGVLSVPHPPYHVQDIECSDQDASVYVAVEGSTCRLVVTGAKGRSAVQVSFTIPA